MHGSELEVTRSNYVLCDVFILIDGEIENQRKLKGIFFLGKFQKSNSAKEDNRCVMALLKDLPT